MTEPRRLVFPPDAPAVPQHETPRAVVFREPRAARQECVVASSQVPATLQFDSTPRAPQAVCFGASAPSADSESAAPGALVFPDKPVGLVRESTPAPAFQQVQHPLHAAALRECQSREASLYAAHQPRIARLVGELLPLTVETLESFGARMLAQCRQHALSAAAASKQYAELNAAELLRAAVAAAQPTVGLVAKLRQKIQGSPQEHLARIGGLRQHLAQTLQALRDARPEVQDDALRLALHVLALQGVLGVCGTPPDGLLSRTLAQRQTLLDAALTQARLVLAQIKLQEETAALQMGECDRLLAVTMSAALLTESVQRPRG